jgi:energy-coupling factor transporter ATP-binding protein EcfA2
VAKQLPRTNPDLLDAWEEYSEFALAASIFKKWGGLFLISGALSRRVWVVTDPTYPALYPNLYVLLTGYPGSGKDTVINKIVAILRSANEGLEQGTGFHFSGRSISPKGVIDLLASEDAEFAFQTRVDGKNETVKYHSFLLCAPEMTTMMPVYNTQLIAFLNELYNCTDPFEEQVRGRGAVSSVSIQNPHVAAFLGIQPATLFEVFPEQAFRMGFFSRVNLIYTRERFAARPYDDNRPNREVIFPKLVSDIRSIANLSGKMTTTPEFREALTYFAENGPGALKQTRFEDYNTRRWLHLHKIAMICSVSESSNLKIEMRHFERAHKYLIDAEVDLPLVFEGITTSDGFEHTVEQLLINSKTAIITHQTLERSLRRTHKPYEVGQIISSMIRSGDLEEVPSKSGLPKYKITEEIKRKLH